MPLAALEKTEEAVSAYQELYEDLKDNPEFLEAYVYLLREAGDVTRAREVANQYLAIVPDDADANPLWIASNQNHIVKIRNSLWYTGRR